MDNSLLPPPHNWATVRLFRHLGFRWRAGLDRLPPGALRRWLFTLVWGAVVAVLFTWAMTWGARHLAAAGHLSWEEEFLRRAARELPISYYKGIEFGIVGGSVLLWPAMFLGAGIGIWMGHPLRGLLLPVSYALISLNTALGWAMWDRQRPQFIERGLAAPDFNAFPSGHMAHVPVAYGLLIWFWIRSSRSMVEKCLAVFLAVAIGAVVALGRLRIGAHWPSDLVGGLFLGILWLAVCMVAVRRAEKGARRETQEGEK